MYVVVVNDPGDKAHPNANYNPNYLTARRRGTCGRARPTSSTRRWTRSRAVAASSPPATPELLQVDKPGRAIGEQGPFVRATDTTAANRRIAIHGVNFGAIGTGANRARSRSPTRARCSRARSPGWRRPPSWPTSTRAASSAGATARSSCRSRATQLLFLAGPKQLAIRTAGRRRCACRRPTASPCTSSGAGYSTQRGEGAPRRRSERPRSCRTRIDAAAADSLARAERRRLPRERPDVEALKLQGLGPGGIVGAHELRAATPEDPRFNVQGSVIDGRYFHENATAWRRVERRRHARRRRRHPPRAQGAALTAVAKTSTAYNSRGANARRRRASTGSGS